jgi:hypothetical protein
LVAAILNAKAWFKAYQTIQAKPDITTFQLTSPHRKIELATWINASETSTNQEE